MNKRFKNRLKKQFETEIPESLEKDNILNLLPEKDEKSETVIRKNFTFKRTVSLVASFILVFGIAAVYVGTQSQKEESNQSKNSEITNNVSEVVKYTTYEPIFEKLEKIKKNNYIYDAMEEVADDYNAGSGSTYTDAQNSSKKDYGTTNVQENGVDEGDIIKTDGKYLYVISSADRSKFSVVDCNTLKTVSQVEFENDVYLFEMYLTGNTVVCVGRKYKPLSEQTGCYAIYDTLYPFDESETVVYVYDVSDKAQPKQKNTFNQSGTYYSSRLIDKKLYCVSTYYTDIYNGDITDACIPTTSFNGNKEKIPANRISVIEDAKAPSYIVISVLDVESGEKPVTEAVFGNAENIYATVNNLYVVDTEYNDSGTVSNIFKFDYSDSGINFVCKGTVKGRMLNQFSMSEQDGYLRVAVTETTLVETTSANGLTASASTSVSANSLYVLNENMQQIGSVKNLAKDETIESVRFIGDTAYVVTFRQTDPLFVIDLSNPEKPIVKGELKITGFSEYLHPVGENLLVGVGNDGTQSGTNGDAKISVFDVSDPTNPTEASKITVNNGRGYVHSPVAENHKCYVTLNKSEFFVPFTVTDYVYSNKNELSKNTGAYYIQYKITEKEITEVARYRLCKSGSVSGGTYAGNIFYAVVYNFENSEHELIAFDINTHAETGRIVL